jgi:protein involved in polysaccharide export with SLBB domain
VAASADQIEEVLRKDPGLLVELKRWIAKEATDRGQIVDDSDLTDQAVFNRLTTDLEFRAVATRLLQRYGYLLPKLNPESDAAKEAELLRQQRVRRLLKAAEVEDEEVARGKRSEKQSDLDRAELREREYDREAGDQAPRPRERRREALSPAEVPPEAVPFDLRDRTNPRPPLRNPLEEPEIPSRKVVQMAGDLDFPSSRLPSATLSSTGIPPLEARGYPLARVGELAESGIPPQPSSEAQTRERATSSSSMREKPPREEEADYLAVVPRPNPYADIPSLYDMYRQVSPRPPEPKRFGSDVFRDGARDSELLPMDLPVGPDYVVGPGDSLAIDLWGAISQRLYRTVDREGRLALPEVGPTLVSGRTLGEVQQAVQQILRTQFRDVSADVSLSRLRTIRVYVVGDVEHAGAYDISSLSTPLNALFVAGGPTSRGSLRVLRHHRGKELIQEVDVYALLLHGVRSDIKRLENGDTVLVPPIGPQVTIEGAVRRPAIYELRGEKTLAEAVELAGGILPTATLQKIQVQRVEVHQKRTMLSLDIPEAGSVEAINKQLDSFTIQDGDEVRIFPIAPYNQDAIYLQGHVLRPGRYSYRAGMKLTDLVSSYADLLPEPAAKYAEIIRLNPPNYTPSVESFDLTAALANPAVAPALQPLDTVRIFSRYDFENPPTVKVAGEVRNPGTYRTSGQIHLRDAIQLAGGLTPDALADNAQVFSHLPDSKLKIMSIDLKQALAGNPIDNILLQPRDLILIHRNLAKVDPPSVYLKGEVAKPGRYPLTTNMGVADLIHLSGGLKRSAYPESADLTRYLTQDSKKQVGEHYEINIADALAGEPNHDLPLRDGDVLTIPQLPGWNDIGASITVTGEVEHPGVYGIRSSERLSSVLERAGGFRPTAYPQAAVLERIEVRQLQEKSRQELIQRLEQEAASVKVSLSTTAGEQGALQQASVQQRQRVLEALRKAPVTGRLVIRLRSNLAEFQNSPDDVELRAGDKLFIPKPPDFVLVAGQVYNSNAINYVPRKSAAWYLRQAGGPTNLAEQNAIFIIRVNGSVVSGKGKGWWSGNVLSTRIEPGDTIMVPEKPIGGGTFWKNFLTVAQIASSASIAAAVATR